MGRQDCTDVGPRDRLSVERHSVVAALLFRQDRRSERCSA